jgi:hypothetical protein
MEHRYLHLSLALTPIITQVGKAQNDHRFYLEVLATGPHYILLDILHLLPPHLHDPNLLRLQDTIVYSVLRVRP